MATTSTIPLNSSWSMRRLSRGEAGFGAADFDAARRGGGVGPLRRCTAARTRAR